MVAAQRALLIVKGQPMRIRRDAMLHQRAQHAGMFQHMGRVPQGRRRRDDDPPPGREQPDHALGQLEQMGMGGGEKMGHHRLGDELPLAPLRCQPKWLRMIEKPDLIVKIPAHRKAEHIDPPDLQPGQPISQRHVLGAQKAVVQILDADLPPLLRGQGPAQGVDMAHADQKVFPGEISQDQRPSSVSKASPFPCRNSPPIASPKRSAPPPGGPSRAEPPRFGRSVAQAQGLTRGRSGD